MLSLKRLFAITALLGFFNGVIYLLAPSWVITMLDGNISAVALLNTRYYGVYAFGWAVLLWLGKDIKNQRVQWLIGFAIAISLLLSAIVSWDGVISGAFNVYGWLFVFLDTSLSIAFLWTLTKNWVSGK